MYRQYWGLREAPFRTSVDPRFFYQTPNAEEAIARLHFLVEERRRIGLCLGPAGGGKSMLLEVFARQLRRGSVHVVNVAVRGVDLHELFWLLAANLGEHPGRNDSEFHLWHSITDRLVDNRLQQLDTVILLDDIDEAEPPVIDAVARLTEFDRTNQPRLTIVATATTSQLRRIEGRLLDLAELRIELEPWEQADTIGYVMAALRQAGRRDPAFDDDAMIRLHELCDGIPRRIAQLANLALLAGAGQRAERIDADIVESALQELASIAV
jgi:type II secretory pathway predicted ATPase ExeA